MENTQENNKLIAEFMGALTVKGKMFFPADLSFPKKEFIESLKYHCSWDWLIPVVDKIYSSDEYIKYKEFLSGIFNEEPVSINTKFIESTHETVIEFIKWYNNRLG